jgi:hypothetical protein
VTAQEKRQQMVAEGLRPIKEEIIAQSRKIPGQAVITKEGDSGRPSGIEIGDVDADVGDVGVSVSASGNGGSGSGGASAGGGSNQKKQAPSLKTDFANLSGEKERRQQRWQANDAAGPNMNNPVSKTVQQTEERNRLLQIMKADEKAREIAKHRALRNKKEQHRRKEKHYQIRQRRVFDSGGMQLTCSSSSSESDSSDEEHFQDTGERGETLWWHFR